MASTAPHGWQAGYIVTMIVVGLILIIGFGFYEACLAPMPFLNYNHLSSLVYGLDVATARYVGNTFSVVFFVFLFLASWLIHITGRFK
ncbi:hypothetical protein PENARI_c005G10372 [Penicillium arizonense]|uniref:Uncharacterized protein n=1 Tax=Penicillium arizonense TaxID=1835702 RepID=A0A1F5LP18_PENAI|nr:hypothetical protein PENARI_c005G10372 [Penicillium arizonense]OGE54875.1 hypothetical protein PENARI_c005G10372 [Penicillium arizonense]